jgi:ATP-dependent Clp protease adapter protein ClpS
VPEVSADEAWSIMLEAHDRGRAVVLVCPLERAELYAERLGARGVGATVEAG